MEGVVLSLGVRVCTRTHGITGEETCNNVAFWESNTGLGTWTTGVSMEAE